MVNEGLMYQIGQCTENDIRMFTQITINIKQVTRNMSPSTKNLPKYLREFNLDFNELFLVYGF